MTPAQDFFVGCLAILIGTLLTGGAIFESQILMGLVKSRLLVESVGKATARGIIAAIGLISIALGVLIAIGWRINW